MSPEKALTQSIRLRHAASILDLMAGGCTASEAARSLGHKTDYARRIIGTAREALTDPDFRIPCRSKLREERQP